MFLIRNQSNDPAFNLALEEYLLTKTSFEVVMLWRNSKAVVIGRNQNAMEEIDANYIREQNIAVVRRISGGGAVYHDMGNINYTIICRKTMDNFSNYEAFTMPICDYLRTLGVNAYFSGRNDLLIDGQKFSGNAQVVRKGRIMHHGCILFDSDFSDLSKALQSKTEKIESKGVKSIRKRVTNILPHLPSPLTSGEFYNNLANYFCDQVKGISEYTLTPQDITAVCKLKDEKYTDWEWNYGASPAYNWRNSRRYPFGTIDIRLNVDSGVIQEVHIYGDFFGVADISELEKILLGVRHERKAIYAALENVDVGSYIHRMNKTELLDML